MARRLAHNVGRIARFLGGAVLDNWGLLLLLALWELWIAIGHLNSIVMPHSWLAVSDIFAAPAIYAGNLARTAGIAGVGLAIGMSLGTGLAIASWFSRIAAGFLSVFTLLFASVPVVAFIPILGRLFGYDVRSIVAIVALICFFPSYVFTASGLRALPPGSADLFTVLGSRRGAIFWHVAMPSALLNWTIALRIVAPAAILAAMVAEFLMGGQGLGTMIWDAMEEFNSARAIGGSLVAAILSVICFWLATKAESAVRERWG